MFQRPPDCGQCQRPLQTRLCVYGESAYEEWVCCANCPHLVALNPESQRAQSLESGSLHPDAGDPTQESQPSRSSVHPPAVRRILSEKGLLKGDPPPDKGPVGSENRWMDEQADNLLRHQLLVGLQRELEQALVEERYEDAAAIRDFLQELERPPSQ